MRLPSHLLTVGVTVFCGLANAQNVRSPASDYPNKAVRIVVGFPAGGPSDMIARAVSQKLAAAFGQQFVIDNRPGAATNIGMELTAKSPPDGYTLLMISIGLAANPSREGRKRRSPSQDRRSHT